MGMPFNCHISLSYTLILDPAMAPPFQIYVYPGAGTNGGSKGDHIQIMPPFNVTEKEIHFIVDRVAGAIEVFFAQLEPEPPLRGNL